MFLGLFRFYKEKKMKNVYYHMKLLPVIHYPYLLVWVVSNLGQNKFCGQIFAVFHCKEFTPEDTLRIHSRHLQALEYGIISSCST